MLFGQAALSEGNVGAVTEFGFLFGWGRIFYPGVLQ
jgi:hypothetical protein